MKTNSEGFKAAEKLIDQFGFMRFTSAEGGVTIHASKIIGLRAATKESGHATQLTLTSGSGFNAREFCQYVMEPYEEIDSALSWWLDYMAKKAKEETGEDWK